MSFRSSVNQVNVPNVLPVQTTTLNVNCVSGTQNNQAISLPAGTYMINMGIQLQAGAGTGSAAVTIMNFGISTSATIISPPNILPIQAVTSFIYPGGVNGVALGIGAQMINGRCFLFNIPTNQTLYFFNTITWALTGAQTLTSNQSVTITQLI